MNWKNAMSQDVPQHEEKVMIAIDGLECLATYDEHERGFRLHESKKLVWIEQGGAHIQWKPLRAAQGQ
jgi:hypothetical protein